MPSNYARIEADNILRRGTEFRDIGELLAEKLYSEPSHFVFELLQNAEDALARRSSTDRRMGYPKSVEFNLFHDRLEVRHFGAAFTPADVRGICDVLNGTKSDDPSLIGRFGIGFKSVYTVTSSPEIHSGDEHFRIEGYIRPKPAPARSTRPGETLFVFPFNHQTLAPETAYDLIKERLTHLGINALLFLRQIDEINWSIDGQNTGQFTRQTTPFRLGRRVEILGRSGETSEDQEWIVYERATKLSALPLEVAFKIVANENEASGERIECLARSHLFVFFPTEKQMNVGFLLNGPFLTTPSRDNILQHLTNQELVEEAAQLVAETLSHLKSINLLTAEALQTYPLQRDHFPAGDLFCPLFDSVQKALGSQPLIPIEGGKHAMAESARIASSADMRDLLSKTQLGRLCGIDSGLHWVSSAITNARTPILRAYLEQDLGIEEMRPDAFIGRLNESFLTAQPDSWLIQFYEFLLNQRALWSGASSQSYRPGQLRLQPILRLQDGSHVLPPVYGQVANVFLPPEGSTTFPIIRRKVAANPNARLFLEQLGLTEPDIVDFVITHILPKFNPERAKSFESGSFDSTYEKDIGQIARALASNYTARKQSMTKMLRDMSFIRAFNGPKNRTALRTPQSVYLRSAELDDYFSNDPSIWFVDESTRNLKKTAIELQVATEVRIECLPADYHGFVALEKEAGRNRRGLQRFDPDARIDGLDHALASMTISKARYFWNRLLVPNNHLIRGDVQSSVRKGFTDAKSVRLLSHAGKMVVEARWLPDKNGNWRQPGELTLQDLPDGFVKDEALGNALGMDSALQLVVRNYGVGSDLLRFFVENPDAQQIIKQLQEKAAKAAANKNGDLKDLSLVSAVNDFFEKPGRTPVAIENLIDRPVANPALRAERVRDEIELKKNDAISTKRPASFSTSRTWEPKNDAIRAFLLEEYRGQCQICNDIFYKRDGNPYFEGLYFLSRKDNSWVDIAGSVLCLCPTCCAKILHGSKHSDIPIGEQIQALVPRVNGKRMPLRISLSLCDEPVHLRFTERHLIEVQALMSVAESAEL